MILVASVCILSQLPVAYSTTIASHVISFDNSTIVQAIENTALISTTQINKTYSNKTVLVKKGDYLELSLPVHSEDGYAWEFNFPQGNNLLKITEQPHILNPNYYGGGPDIIHWLIQAVDNGNILINLTESKPGIVDSTINTFNLTTMIRDTTIKIDKTYNEKSIELKKGDIFEINLDEHRDGGYGWRFTSDLDKNMFQIIGDGTTSDNPDLPGSMGKKHFLIKVIRAGFGSIDLKESRFWETSSTINTFKLTTTVEDSVPITTTPINESYSNQTILVKKGEYLELTLPVHSQTGYSWELNLPLDSNVLKVIEEYDFVNPYYAYGDTADRMKFWLIQAVGDGEVSINLKESKSGVVDSTINTFNLAAIVKETTIKIDKTYNEKSIKLEKDDVFEINLEGGPSGASWKDNVPLNMFKVIGSGYTTYDPHIVGSMGIKHLLLKVISTGLGTINLQQSTPWVSNNIETFNLTTIVEPVLPVTLTNIKSLFTTQSSVNLSWNSSTESVGITSYNIYNNLILVGSSTTNNYTVKGLTEKTAYNFTVRAMDSNGNIFAKSDILNVITRANGDVNSDGKINILDYMFIKAYLTPNRKLIRPGVFDEHILDINADNKIDIADYARLKKILLKK